MIHKKRLLAEMTAKVEKAQKVFFLYGFYWMRFSKTLEILQRMENN